MHYIIINFNASSNHSILYAIRQDRKRLEIFATIDTFYFTILIFFQPSFSSHHKGNFILEIGIVLRDWKPIVHYP